MVYILRKTANIKQRKAVVECERRVFSFSTTFEKLKTCVQVSLNSFESPKQRFG
jgi:hypothetical protein